MALRTELRILYAGVQPIDIEFDTGSSVVKPIYYTEIERISKKINSKVFIFGHTDNIGSIESNQQLSQARANAVKDILVNRYNILADNIIAEGYGSNRPIADNSTPEGRKRNRRIEMVRDVEITGDIANYIKSFTFTDNSSDNLDDLSLVLHDSFDEWLSVWKPSKGDRLKAYIKDLFCGDFEIDEIYFSGYPKQLDLKAISAPPSKNARREFKSRAWENVKLSQILYDLARTSDYKIFYDVLNDVEYDRKDQRDESDLMFLKKICDDNCYSLKVTSGKIVIFDPKKYEQKEPLFELTQENIISYSLRTQSHDLYTACTVEYYDDWEDEVYTYTHRSENGGMATGQTLMIKKRVTSLAEAKELAERSLRKENQKETIASFVVGPNVNNNLFLASNTFTISGFGSFDGKYIIDKATHSIQTGYNIEIESHKVQN